MYRTAPHKSVVFNGTTKEEVADELAILADETIEYVYGSVIQKVNERGEVVKRYDVRVIVKLEEK